MAEKVKDWGEIRLALVDKRIDRKSYGSIPNTGEIELVRHWPEIHDSQCPDVVAFLDAFTDTGNTEQQKYVTDPIAGKGPRGGEDAVYQGNWRLIGNYYDTERKGTPGVWQILRKDWITALDWTDAKLLEGEDRDTANGGSAIHLMVEIDGVAPASAQDLALAFRTGSPFTNPTIQGKQRTGVFYCLWSQPKQMPNDGAYSITAILSQRHGYLKGYADYGSIEPEDVYQLLHVPTKIVQSLIDGADPVSGVTYKVAGSTVIANYSQPENTWDLTFRQTDLTKIEGTEITIAEDCFSTTKQMPYFNLTPTEVAAIPMTFAQGVLKRLQATITRWKDKWNATLITVTAKTVTDTTFEVNDAGVTYTHRIAWNKASPPSSIGGATTNARYISAPSRNPDCTWNYHYVTWPAADKWTSGSFGQWQSVYRQQNEPVTGRRAWYRKTTYSYVTVEVVASCALAYGGTRQPQPCGNGNWLKMTEVEGDNIWVFDSYV
jgi:hypothetical protein